MGFNEDVTEYFWNLFIYIMATRQILFCWWSGYLPLLFTDDGGEFIHQCLKLFGGVMVTFPYAYDIPTPDVNPAQEGGESTS